MSTLQETVIQVLQQSAERPRVPGQPGTIAGSVAARRRRTGRRQEQRP